MIHTVVARLTTVTKHIQYLEPGIYIPPGTYVHPQRRPTIRKSCALLAKIRGSVSTLYLVLSLDPQH